MKPAVETITGRVNLALLDKADRLFRNDDDGTLIEVLQNARRAGATRIDVAIEELSGAECRITIQDNGRGIDNFQSLLTLGASHWDSETKEREEPAGMGFFSLCRTGVQVHSGSRSVNIAPSVFLGKSEARVEVRHEHVQGTRIIFRRSSSRTASVAALERVTEFCPLEVCLDGTSLPRHDFLEGALYRELIDGIEVGFSPAFTWRNSSYWQDELNWNFYGGRVRYAFDRFPCVLGINKDGSPASLSARFNVFDTGRVKLQLPDRRAIIEDELLREFLRKARAAAYRCFQRQGQHVLPFKNWQEARELGVELPEAAPLLRSWHATPLDDNIDPVFGRSEPRLLSDLARVVRVGRDLPDGHTLEGALHCGATVEGALYQEQSDHEGYSWYDQLPRIVETAVFVEGVPYEKWQASGGGRPGSIEVEVTIEQKGAAERKTRLPAKIHVDSNYYGELDFVAVNQSPWDNDELKGPFCVIDFLMSATFCASDDSESDSWETQFEAHREFVEREVNEYFRGPRATLLAILSQAIEWRAGQLAEQIGVREIHFHRTEDRRWDVELVN
jgi:hypothetical protein